jgi:Zn-dependent protease
VTSRSKGWVVGRVAGAPVVVTPSWFLAAVVLTFVFAPTARALAPLLDTTGVLVVSFAFVLLLFGSVFLHEVAHALVARARGHQVTELALTLWGGHTAYTGGSRRPADAALVAVVGPLTNLALAVGLWFSFQAQTVTSSVPAMLLYAGAFANAFVGLFNLLPGLPLDGGQILESLVWAVTGSRSKGTVVAGWLGRLVAVGVVVGVLVWPLAQGRQTSWVTVMWAALVGAFLWAGAGEAIAAERRRERLRGLTVRTLVTPAVVVRSGTSVADAGTVVAGHPSSAIVVVGPTGDPLGWVDPSAAAAVPREQAATTPVDAAVVPFPPGSGVDAHLSGPDLLERLARSSAGARVVPVLDGGSVTGVLDVARVAAATRK